ncbi:hypothetical protein E2542_SST04936 [Spatholobus suberectus]|nr:hypothetical protein E2542_SST04936 [Spatholobus suberectus]
MYDKAFGRRLVATQTPLSRSPTVVALTIIEAIRGGVISRSLVSTLLVNTYGRH